MEKINCLTCNEYHDFKSLHYREVAGCIPIITERKFGEYQISKSLRDDLPSYYTVEEIIGTYLGMNPEHKYCNKRSKENKKKDAIYLKTIGLERIW